MDMSPEQGKKPKFTSQTVQSNKAAAASQQAVVPDAVSHEKATGFTSDDFSKLSENENYRYAKNSKQIAHAVIAREKDGSKVALQYHLPKGSTPDTPEVRQLTHIEEITRFGMIRHRAKGEDNKTWYAKRYDHARIKLDDDDEDAVSVDFAYFSEEEQLGKEPFWGSAKEVPKFRKNLSEEVKKDFDAELADIKASTKGGHHMKVHSDSVRHRDAYNVRKPDQNTLMGESARDAYEHFFSAMEDVLSPEIISILKRAFKADIRKTPENQYRPEWLHAYGFSLTPKDENPQHKANLGAAGKWVNTEMMVLERIAKWFSLNQNDPIDITLKTLFDMLNDSELINKIHFEVDVHRKSKFVRFIQDLDAFKKYPIFRKASDLAQATGISYAMLHDQAPMVREIVMGTIPLAQSSTTPKPAFESSAGSGVLADVQMASQPGSHLAPKRDITSTITMLSGENVMPKSQFPTQIKHQRSIVQLQVTSHDPDYEEPWNGTHIVSSTSSGFIIEHEGEKYIVTNAHCVQNNVRVQVRLTNSRENKFDAVPICVSYQSDLALLKVKSIKFQNAVQPVQLGEMVKIHDEVCTIGFPMGGDEISVTKGIVSRIEVGEYSMSGGDMLHAQVDSAINPGNSGGPVFCGDKVVGVAFQGIGEGQSLGYIIPTPIVRHFLKEAFSGNPYRGFPILPVSMDTLENKWQRKFFGMSKSQTGVLVPKTSACGDTHEKLKNGDILLEIDGYKISNQGTVDIPDVGNCLSLLHVTHMKFIGDSVHLKVLRKNAQSGIAEIHDLSIIMDHIPGDSDLIPVAENDKMPTYYINSGLVFVPVSRNYLDGPGSDLEDLYFIDPVKGSYHISDMPKKNPDHQLIAINTVLDCKSTAGYDGLANTIVSKVNGRTINNLRELIDVMESNQDEVHLIEQERKTTVLKNLSPDEMAKIMKSYKIAYDRSEDLRPEAPAAAACADSSDSDCSDESDLIIPEVAAIAVKSSSSSSSSSKEHQKASSSSSNKRKRIIEDDEEVDEAAVIKSLKGTDGITPGQRRFMAKVGSMEHHYKHAPEKEEIIDWDNLTEDDEEEFVPPPRKANSKERKHSTSSSVQKDSSRVSVLTGGLGLFARKPHQRDEQSSNEKEITLPKRANG